MNANELNGKVNILVKPNSSKNEITSMDSNILKVNIKAPAEDNKANVEVIKFFSRLTKKKVRIVSGLKSKKKLIEIL